MRVCFLLFFVVSVANGLIAAVFVCCALHMCSSCRYGRSVAPKQHYPTKVTTNALFIMILFIHHLRVCNSVHSYLYVIYCTVTVSHVCSASSVFIAFRSSYQHYPLLSSGRSRGLTSAHTHSCILNTDLCQQRQSRFCKSADCLYRSICQSVVQQGSQSHEIYE
jgi:hypothetical protein